MVQQQTAPLPTVVKEIRESGVPTQRWVRELEKRLEELDAVVVVTGPEGSGKSTFARHLAQRVDSGFSNQRVHYSPRHYLEDLVDRSPGEAIVFDEGAEGLHNRNAMANENKKLNEILMECRIYHLLNIVCFPRFRSVDLYLQKFRAWSWVYVEIHPETKERIANIRIRNQRVDIPTDAKLEDLHEAYPLAARCTFPKIESDDFERNEKRKKEYIRRKVEEMGD